MRYMINYNESVMKVLNSVAEKLEEYGFKTCITNSSENFIDWKLYYGYGKVLVGVDVLDILKEYEKKYPEIVKPIYFTKNLYSQGIIPSTYLYEKSQGKYLAICEGDDYWIDENKLQKQVDFLEKNKEYSAVYHNVRVVDENGNKIKNKKYSRTDKVILGIGFTILGLFVLSIAIPIIYVVLASFMDPTVLNNQGLSFNIKDWTLDAYRRVLENEMIWRGFLNSFLYSLAFTVISVFVTLLAAYPLSKKEFVGRKVFNIIFLITMFFGGGMIPTFILINQLHMVNTVWAILIPGAFNVWNMILARTYYQSIPTELREASAIDGANEIQHFFKIMIPVCKPIIAVLALWSFVGMWNSYFDAMIYLNDANLQPLQLVLRSILVQNTPQPGMIADIQSTAEMAKIAEQLKYATIVVSSLPLLVMYPFFQKYFDKGIMVGSVKG